MKNSYLGDPYTTCTKTVVQDSYYIKNEIAHHVYKKGICEMEFFLNSVYDLCNCCPTYMINQVFK